MPRMRNSRCASWWLKFWRSFPSPGRASSRAEQRVSASTLAEELFNVSQIFCLLVRGQALHENSAIALLENTVVEQGQQPAVLHGTDQPAKTLFQGDHRRRHLVFKKRVASAFLDRANAGCNHRIVGHSEGQAIDDHAAQLLALNVYTLPE